MSGNVSEWVWDLYGGYSHEPVTDPYGPAVGSYRVKRGGGWDDSPFNMRASRRYYNFPTGSYDGLGFRLGLHP